MGKGFIQKVVRCDTAVQRRIVAVDMKMYEIFRFHILFPILLCRAIGFNVRR